MEAESDQWKNSWQNMFYILESILGGEVVDGVSELRLNGPC